MSDWNNYLINSLTKYGGNFYVILRTGLANSPFMLSKLTEQNVLQILQHKTVSNHNQYQRHSKIKEKIITPLMEDESIIRDSNWLKEFGKPLMKGKEGFVFDHPTRSMFILKDSPVQAPPVQIPLPMPKPESIQRTLPLPIKKPASPPRIIKKTPPRKLINPFKPSPEYRPMKFIDLQTQKTLDFSSVHRRSSPIQRSSPRLPSTSPENIRSSVSSSKVVSRKSSSPKTSPRALQGAEDLLFLMKSNVRPSSDCPFKESFKGRFKNSVLNVLEESLKQVGSVNKRFSNDELTVRPSLIHQGKHGLFANKKYFQKGDFIGAYLGEFKYLSSGPHVMKHRRIVYEQDPSNPETIGDRIVGFVDATKDSVASAVKYARIDPSSRYANACFQQFGNNIYLRARAAIKNGTEIIVAPGKHV
jgi:hypothetical protein